MAHLQALSDVVAEQRHGGVHVGDLRQVGMRCQAQNWQAQN